MARIDIAQVKEGGAVAQLLQHDPVRPHSERAFEQLFRASLHHTVAILRIGHMNDVAMRKCQLAGVLDCQYPLMVRDQVEQAL